jgi:uncharacterized protein YndB with AHSA1/START domain
MLPRNFQYFSPTYLLNQLLMAAKKKIELEFILNAAPKLIYSMLTTPSGLSEWFADDVNIKDDTYTFLWDGMEERALAIQKSKDQSIRFVWEHEDDEAYYWEFLIKLDPLTQDVALIVTDHVEKGEEDSTRHLWETQIERLRRVVGG